MARPRGMRKINGIWYLPNGTVAPSSASKVQGTDTPTPVVTIAPMPAQSVTEASQHIGSSMLREDGILEHCTDVAVERVKTQGVAMYTSKEIKRIEEMTGLVFAGNFANSDAGKYSGELVPVFLRSDHTDEKRQEDLTRIRKGI